MIHPAHEHARGPIPLIATGPGGDFIDELYIQGDKLVPPPTPTPGLPMLRARPERPAPRPHQEPWNWPCFWRAVPLGMLIMIAFIALAVAFLFALVLAPLIYGARHGIHS